MNSPIVLEQWYPIVMSKRTREELEEEEIEEPKESKPRRSEADVRNEHIDEGAILIEFEPHPNASKQVITWWRGMEKYGFKVSDDGCLIPHKQYWGSKGGKEEKKTRPSCRSLSSQFFNDKVADRDRSPNNEGWPCTETYSHLCHVWNCASGEHIHVEEQWKNVKRNYCGLQDKCNCSNKTKCIRMYHNSFWDWKFNYLDYDTPKLKYKIQKLMPDYKFKILPKNHYINEDLKRSNRTLRKKKDKSQNKK